MKPNKQVIKLFLLGVLAMLLLNFPFLSLPSKIKLVFGFPSLYLYVFGLWISLLIISFLILKQKKTSDKKKGDANE